MTDRHARQSFLGPQAPHALANCVVAVVGLGGGGSHIAQQLAHIGFANVQLYDGDTAELSNLNRLIGASFDDAQNRNKKVDIARKLMLAVNPDMRIETFACNWQLAAQSIHEADVIVSCVDSYAARQDIEATARRFLIPLLDIGMDVHLIDGRPHISGQVILSLPGGPCMKCLGFLTEDNLQKEAEQYGAAGARPQVVWANGILASTAVGLLVDLFTAWNGLPSGGEYLHLDGNTNLVFRSPRLEFAPKPFLNDEMPRADVIYNILHLECLPPRHFNPELPSSLSDVIVCLLQKDRDRRYPNPHSLLQTLSTLP